MKKLTLREVKPVLQVGTFPDGPVVKNPHANAGDIGSIPSLRRSYMPRSN